MSRALHHTDFLFQTKTGTYPLSTQCEMLVDAGYQGITVSGWSSELNSLSIVKEHGLYVAAVYAIFRPGLEEFVTNIFNTVEEGTRFELAFDSGDGIQKNDKDILKKLLKICDERNLDIALYPHLLYGMQTTSEAVKLCEEFNHPRLGIVFNAFHWFAGKELELDKRLDTAFPWLKQVNLSGSRFSPLGWGHVATIEPLDDGELDNFQIFGALEQRGYQGHYGVLSWKSMGGECFR
ncbi:sugar phosphate isomerase/epimerase family protein [Acinetobacter gerneri]|uniref:sugar phosphate isomerase/epimerase family protein n=1 Tax=Acinetobacter gerneri TaxID=202952 RepID=UPI0028AD1DB1|nr:TIM barrel protein [Acinetobacter gerneri]